MSAYDYGTNVALAKLGFGMDDVVQGAQGGARALFSNMAPRPEMNPNLAAILPTHLKAWDSVKGVAHSGANLVRGGIFGSPVDTYNRLHAVSNGNLGTMLGNHYKNTFMPAMKDTILGGKGNLGQAAGYAQKALAIGKPAYDIYKATQAPRENRGEMVGRAIASTATAPITGQFGLLGQMALAKPIAAVGGWVGKRFDPKPPAVTGNPLPPQPFR
jgi:hypothetical protein